MESDNKKTQNALPDVNVLIRGKGTVLPVGSYSVQTPTNTLDSNNSTGINEKNKSNAEKFDSKTYANTNLLIAIISLFIIPYMAIGSFTGACFGLYYSFKNNSGWVRRLIYITTMVISIVSLVLKAMISRL